MSVAIRLKRHGTRNRPFYRIVVMDSRRPRDGRVIEEVGRYQPTEAEGAQATLDDVRVRQWIDKGARPSPTVRRILNRQIRGERTSDAEPAETPEPEQPAEPPEPEQQPAEPSEQATPASEE